MICKDKESFALFQINQPYDFDFGKKIQISLTRSLSAVIPSVTLLVLFVLSSELFILLSLAPAIICIYLI